MLIEDGLTYMTQGYETMAYLCLFGGNEDDDVSESTAHLQWWGNEDEEPQYQYRSRFGAWVKSGEAITSQSLLDAQSFAQADLDEGFAGIADSIQVQIATINPKRVKLTAQINLPDGTSVPFEMEVDIDT
jgi:phage gp46-like protein